MAEDREGAVKILIAIDELEAMAANAPRIPLIPQVRVDKQRVYDRLEDVRAVVPLAVREARGE